MTKSNITIATLALIGATLMSGAAFAQGSAGGGGGGGGGGGAGGFSAESTPLIAAVPPTFPRPTQITYENPECGAETAVRIDLPVAMLNDLCEAN